jgi:hypothetical protein
MAVHELRAILARLPEIRHPCDVDLLLFFYRHPCALLTAEQLVSYLGYGREQTARSLEGLIEARLVTRSQNPNHAARLYVLEWEAFPGGLFASLIKIVATRAGRQEAIQLLRPGSAERGPTSQRRRPRLHKAA